MKTVCADPSSRAHSFHKIIDENIEETKITSAIQPSCKKGCAYCCYIEVRVTEDEAALIVKWAREQEIEINLNSLQTQLLGHENISYKDRRCVFLNNENQCKIYEHRPAACRKYLVKSEPFKCNSEKHIKGVVEVYASNAAEILASAAMNVQKSGNLSEMLLEELGHHSGVNST